MMIKNKKVLGIIWIAISSGLLSCATTPSSSLYTKQSGVNRTIADDFELNFLPETETRYDLNDYAGKNTYYGFMEEMITPTLKKLAAREKCPNSNEEALKQGCGVSVKLDDHNYNFHINFPNSEMGGRSYGWTDKKVGDWSDKMYLDNLGQVVSSGNKSDLKKFYKTLIELLGACDAKGLSGLKEDPTQRVANNFLAIYTAEQYRAMINDSRWDDALFQVTMLGAFHGGQSTFTKYYLGKFSTKSFKQAPGVYKGGVKGQPKEADIIDYWQFSSKADSRRSGINLTRSDFQLMGKAITQYYSKDKKSKIKDIQKIVGASNNVFSAISQYFTENKAKVGKIDELAELVPEFLITVRDDANSITQSLK